MAFWSGAVVTVVDQLASNSTHGVPLKLLGNWLAFLVAAAASKLEGRLAREVDIRVAHHLTPLGDAPCPDGDLFAFWREAARLRLTGRDWRADEKGLVRNAIANDV